MNTQHKLKRATKAHPYRLLRATAAALPALVAILTVLSLAVPSLAQPVPRSPEAQIRYVKPDADEGGDGLSWGTAYRYLHDALADWQCNQIWVAKGVYYPDEGDGQIDGERTHSFVLRSGVAIYGGFVGYEESLGERNWEENVTVLSGDLDQNDTTDPETGVVTDAANIVGTDNSYHVVTAPSGVSVAAELNGFTITAGLANGADSYGYGAGVYINDASPTLIHVIIQGNKASVDGGGMFNNGGPTNGGPRFTTVEFRSNLALNNGGGFSTTASDSAVSSVAFYYNEAGVSGGGMYLDTALGQSLSNLTFFDNTAVTGGGLYVRSIGNLSTLSGSFIANTAEDGGGIYLDASLFNLNHVDLEANEASDQGGGIFAELGNHTLNDVTFTGNQAGSEGGGFYGYRTNLVLNDSTVAENTSVLGGGMYIDDDDDGSAGLDVSGTNFVENIASEDGGGLYAVHSPVGELSSSYFLYNEATTGYGGGFYLSDSGPYELSSTDFIGNQAVAGGGMYVEDSDPVLIAVRFQSNHAQITDDTLGGGGLSLVDGSNATLSRCTFSGNSAANGGGMYIANSSPTLTNVAFAGNKAGDDIAGSGGGLFKDGGQPTLTNILFSGNAATENGGGMHNGGSGTNVVLTNLTFSGNHAILGVGGGLHSDSPSYMIIHNTVIWNNQDSSGTGTASASIWAAPEAVIDHSLMENLELLSDGNLDGTDPDNDPLLVVPVDPADAPTTSGILSVKFGSPIVDVGDNTPIESLGVLTDLADNDRIYPEGGIVDMGAYELQLACPTEVTPRLYVDHTADLGNTGKDWMNALQDLRDAFTLADNCIGIGTDEIWVAAGVYRPDEGVGMVPGSRTETYQLMDGVAVYGGFAGGEGSLVDRNWVTNVTVLSGDVDSNDDAVDGIVHTPAGIRGGNSYHVVMASEVGNTTVLDGFTITAGQANGSASEPTGHGAGFCNDAGSPTLANLTFIGNIAAKGGGLANLNGSNPPLTDILLENNMATSMGGGIYNEGSSPILSDLTFTGNYAVHGGGLANLSGSNPPLTGVQFTSNTAGTAGGGIYNLESTPTLTGTLLSYNSASSGGAIYNVTSSPTFTNTVLSANTASNGAALYNDASNPSLIQAQVSGNHATGSGAAIYNTASSPVLVGVTVASNRAGIRAGGAFNTANSDPVVRNTIFWDNRDSTTGTGTASATIYNSDGDSEPAIDYSLVQMLSAINHTGSNNLSAKPWFTTPLDPIQAPSTAGDFTLWIFSPAIDAGNNDYNPTLLDTDLAGGPRLINEVIDMGPYEAPYVPLTDVYLPIILRSYTP